MNIRWKEYTPDRKLTVCRVADLDRLAFIFHIAINLIKDPYCRHAACFVVEIILVHVQLHV